MHESERAKWNRKYGIDGITLGSEPSAFLVECLPTIIAATEGRRALDVACGEGRNSLHLARNGFDVLGVDVSDVGLDTARNLAGEAGVQIDYRRMNLRDEMPSGLFNLIVCFNFLLRPLLPKLADAIGPGGFLLIESMMQEYDDEGGPRHRPEFVVAEGELRDLVEAVGLQVLQSGDEPARAKSRVLARMTGTRLEAGSICF